MMWAVLAEEEEMNTDQAQMEAEQVQADRSSQKGARDAVPAKIPSRWRGPGVWLLACLGGGGLLIAVVLAWGYWQLGSLSSTLAYLNGERLFVDRGVLSFGTAKRGEERSLQLVIRNRTGKDVRILGAKSTCSCMGTEEEFPFLLADGGQRELTVRVWVVGKDSLFEKRLDFYTDDENNPVISVTVRGKITD
jgi:hypothetical protein